MEKRYKDDISKKKQTYGTVECWIPGNSQPTTKEVHISCVYVGWPPPPGDGNNVAFYPEDQPVGLPPTATENSQQVEEGI